jgi:hypothetical protein
MIAFGEGGVTAVDHDTRRAANHHLVQLLRRRVALRVIHAPAHVRIERQIVVLDQHLAIAKIGNGRFNQREVARGGLGGRP